MILLKYVRTIIGHFKHYSEDKKWLFAQVSGNGYRCLAKSSFSQEGGRDTVFLKQGALVRLLGFSFKTGLTLHPMWEEHVVLRFGRPLPSSPGRTHLLDVHVLQKRAVGLQDRQGGLVLIFTVAARALPAFCLLDCDDLKQRSQVNQEEGYSGFSFTCH